MLNSSISKLLLLCLFGLLSLNAHAQDKTNLKKDYSLLWEISGNGLSKPSYLFGTMHLRDKRVFDFSDSLLIKFDACDAFASEIRMDSTMYEYWDLSINGDTTNHIRNRLSKKGYARMKEAFKKKGINFDSLYSKNTALLQDLLDEKSEENDKGDSQKQFLDLYLTRLAYNQGKILHGLENLNEYKDLNEAFFERFEDPSWVEKKASFAEIMLQFAYMENLIETYNTGNLDSIQYILNQDTAYSKSQYKTELLDNRNIRMADKLDNLMRTKSVFCAVGAAHLPDTSGMIALLRKKGYTLRCVTPQFTGMASQYKEKTVERTWYHLNDDFHHFEIDMPEQPYKVTSKKLGAQYIYYDIDNGSMSHMEVEYYPHMGMKKVSNDKILNELYRNWQNSHRYNDITQEKVKIGDIDAFKFKAYTDAKFLVVGYFAVANNFIYRTTIFFDKNNQSDISKGERILKSLKINPLPLTDWQDFQDAKGAFSVRFPAPPQFEQVKNKINTQEGETVNYFANIFMSKDADKGFTYMLRYSDLPNGKVVLEDSTYMAAILNEATAKFKDLKAKVDIDSISNHYGYQERNIKITIEGVSLYLRLVLRGSRLYFLMGQPPLVKDKTHEKNITTWLNSFKLEPFQQPQLTTVSEPDLGITFSFPSSVEPYKKSEDKSYYPYNRIKSFYSTHDYSGTSYFTHATSYSKYYSIPSPDSFWNQYIAHFKNEDSSTNKKHIYIIKDTVLQGLKAKYIIYKQPKVTVNISHQLVFEKNGVLYECGIYVPNESTDDVYVNSFFNTIKILNNNNTESLYTDKKALIFSDLASNIDSIRNNAKSTLNYIRWEKSDVTALTNALAKNYKDDTLTYNSVRLNLLEAVKSIKDPIVLSTMETLINTTQDSTIRDKCMCVLLDLDTLGSVERFFELAKKFDRQGDNLYCLSRFMRDSMERAVYYYDEMLSLSKKPFENTSIVNTTWQLAALDTLGWMNKILKNYTPQYLEAANSIYDKNSLFKRDTLADDEYEAHSLISSYVSLSPYLKDEAKTISFLNKVSQTNQIDILCESVLALVKRKQKISNALWEKASKGKTEWYYLLRQLDNDTLFSIVPPQYFTQKDIAQNNILHSGYDEEDEYGEPTEITLLETQKYKGKTLYVFKMYYKYDDEETNYIAVTSQPSDKNKVDFNPEISYLSQELEDVKDYKSVVKQILKEHEEREKLKEKSEK